MFEFEPCSAAQAVADCAQALGPDAEAIRSELQRGICAASRCEQGTAITRSEGDELAIVAYQGEHGRAFYKYVCDIARRGGFASVRYHSTRAGMGRYIGDLATEVEKVYRTRF